MNTDQLISPREAARELHVSCDTLRRWANEGRISSTRTLGGHHRYDLHEIRELAGVFQSLISPHTQGGTS
jgi:excisionase family DNA binding protein